MHSFLLLRGFCGKDMPLSAHSDSGNIRVASSLEALHMNKVAVNIFVQVLSKETGIFTSGFYTMNEMLTEARQGVQ